jgi:hypothetical protein
MVRIINTERSTPILSLQSERSKALLQLFAILISNNSDRVAELLVGYSVPIPDKSDKVISEQLMAAIAECNAEFNEELAKILFECCLENDYDNFNFKSIFRKKEKAEDDNSGSRAGNGGGVFNGIANVIGSLGGTIGGVIQGRQAKDQATAQTLQNIYNYKAQLSATQQTNVKSKNVMVISLFVLLGIVLLAIAYTSKQKSQQSLI